jgi:murein DD-endopeptidase MepM/ murein hydrolase activator NlpD
MQIILLHSKFKQAHSVTLSPRHLLLALVALTFSVVGTALLIDYLVTRHTVLSQLPIVRSLFAPTDEENLSRQDRYMRQNLASMAVKLGQMEAQMMRLDALGERVQGLAGVKPEEFNFHELPARGGAEQSSLSGRVEKTLAMKDFKIALDAMSRDLEHRSDYMNVVETTLMSDRIRSKLLPTIQPVNVGYNASGFGWRFDPFNGRNAFHEGIDFPAPVGTPIVAAAGGVVVAAEYHHDFGNMLLIDHGNDILTRYAHSSHLIAKVGDIVKRGEHIADIGSTGRSTGPHLHFEVLVKGIPQDPNKFLAAGASQAKIAALGLR